MDDTEANKRLMTKGEVALYCRVEVRTIDRWMASGRLKALRISRRCVRFRFGDVLIALDKIDQSPRDAAMG